ncbi:CBS domain-containing protein [Xanthomonas euvesicatoria]|uniref:CBS domain-containing protein n=1 Tax=Xanthomonas euvesicatoria TaxID=456327 RepID=UPI0012D7EBC1|nr:CBS domain-containing protein [Xanthomonas euvesicatoria]MCC8613074.1 CBS domain-containing protein [Xanthomonas euvesicatoria pv. euvesicatoria]
MHSYLYNSRLAKAMLFPLHACEIVLRNAVNDVLKQDFSQAWYRNSNFTDLLVPKTREILHHGVEGAKSNNVDDIVAELQFGFWFHLFRSNHFNIWKGRFDRVVRANASINFSEFEPRLARVHKFRNRIAHHEGILGMPSCQSANAVHADIEFLVGAVSQEALQWLVAHSTLAKIIRSKPGRNGNFGPTVEERSDNRFREIDSAASLKDVSASHYSIVKDAGNVIGVISGREIAEFLVSMSLRDGIFELSTHTVSELVSEIAGAKNFVIVEPSVPLTELGKLISKKRHAVVVSPLGEVKGVIEASHRRY